MTDAMIRLVDLEKHYPGQAHAAVEKLNMEIPAGEIVILVGPSGCGKTTTMKMINRIIEPSSGKIILQGEDVTKTNPDQLRRRIGYVIQQIGLFPHQTIFDNVATVPRMLKWPASKIRGRVDELLELVGLDPAQYRDRYPKQLSGGQRQRVGVARALSADPPVMLMDEPFGAIDPITRERLQNEFLRLQQEIRKTIVFVTHDIGEAIKMGDRIAILRERSVIAQYDTPDAILSAPADDFVRDFIGSGAALRRLNLVRALDHRRSDDLTAHHGDDPSRLTAVARGSGRPVLLLDPDHRPVRWITPDGRPDRAAAGSPGPSAPATIPEDATLADALDAILRSQADAVVVVDAAGRALGVVDLDAVLHAAGDGSAGAGAARATESAGLAGGRTVGPTP